MKNLAQILERIEAARTAVGGEAVRLVAVSKNVTSVEVKELYAQGQLDFGENRVQELAKKRSELSELTDLRWHMIGRLQSNKINQLITQRPTLWQSCDSLERAREVDKRLNFRLDTLLQINSADESSKQGTSCSRAIEIYEQISLECPNLRLLGVMSIGAHTDDERDVKASFEATRRIFDELRAQGATICSMGMSSDFELAIRCGANMVRLGSILY